MTLAHIQVVGFEGPLDLLLELIEAEKLDITQLSLAHVTTQYLARLRGMTVLPPEHLAEFLVVAARLLLLKSKRLFPQFTLTAEEEEGIQSLEAQLREYQKYRDRARAMRAAWTLRARLYAREGFAGVAMTFFPPPQFRVAHFAAVIQSVIDRLPTIERSREDVLAKVVSLEERIRDIQKRAERAAVLSFREFSGENSSREDVILSFLALLELVKQCLLEVEQTGAFHDILIRKHAEP